MKKIVTILFSIILILSSIAGIGCSLWGMQSLNQIKDQSTENLSEGLTLIQDALITTNEGLMIVQDSLEKARENTLIIGNMVLEVSATLESTRETTQTIGSFFTNDLTDVVTQTQDSLLAAQTSATLVDDTLKIISSIPLIGAKYAPNKPLGESIADVSDSLNSLPASFDEIDQNIQDAGNSLYDVELSITELASTINEIDSTLDDAQSVIKDYQDITADLEEKIVDVQEKIPFWVKTLYTVSVILLLWTIIVSLSMFSQAMILIKMHKEQ